MTAISNEASHGWWKPFYKACPLLLHWAAEVPAYGQHKCPRRQDMSITLICFSWKCFLMCFPKCAAMAHCVFLASPLQTPSWGHLVHQVCLSASHWVPLTWATTGLTSWFSSTVIWKDFNPFDGYEMYEIHDYSRDGWYISPALLLLQVFSVPLEPRAHFSIYHLLPWRAASWRSHLLLFELSFAPASFIWVFSGNIQLLPWERAEEKT